MMNRYTILQATAVTYVAIVATTMTPAHAGYPCNITITSSTNASASITTPIYYSDATSVGHPYTAFEIYPRVVNFTISGAQFTDAIAQMLANTTPPRIVAALASEYAAPMSSVSGTGLSQVAIPSSNTGTSFSATYSPFRGWSESRTNSGDGGSGAAKLTSTITMPATGTYYDVPAGLCEARIKPGTTRLITLSINTDTSVAIYNFTKAPAGGVIEGHQVRGDFSYGNVVNSGLARLAYYENPYVKITAPAEIEMGSAIVGDTLTKNISVDIQSNIFSSSGTIEFVIPAPEPGVRIFLNGTENNSIVTFTTPTEKNTTTTITIPISITSNNISGEKTYIMVMTSTIN